MASSKPILLLFQGDDAKALETAAIEDDGKTKTATNGALSGRILRTVLPGAGVSILPTRGTPLLRKSQFKSRPSSKCLVLNAKPISMQYKHKYNYATTWVAGQTAQGILPTTPVLPLSCT